MTVLAFPRQPTAAQAVEAYAPDLEVMLGDFSVERLIDAIIVLTDQIHDARDAGRDLTDLREQRMLARLELERRAA